MKDLYTFLIYLDNVEIGSLTDQPNHVNLFKYMHGIQYNSMHYALRFGGYRITSINQATNERKNVTM